MAPARPTDRATAYAAAVAAGEIVAGRLVKLACERHLRDLDEGPARGLKWRPDLVARVLTFFANLALPDRDDPDTGQPLKFQVQPSQAFILGSIFGWTWAATGYRRFKTAYVEQGKGQGKTPVAAGVGLYGLVADGEQAAEVYAAATKWDQAEITFRDAKRIVGRTPQLARRLDVGGRNLANLASGGFFRPVSADHRGASGPRPHMNLFDEIHEHPSSILLDKMRAGVKSRNQPLNLEITNSGFDRTTICWHHHEYSAKVLKARTPADPCFDDGWFAYVCTLDPCPKHRDEGKDQPVEGCPECDDWRDEGTWLKANPCLGAIIKPDYLREQVRGAVGRPTEEGIVKRLNFCVWTEGETAWLPAALWAKGAQPVNVAALAGRACFGGLDVSSKIDLTALVLCFPDTPTPGSYTLLPRFWLPRAMAKKRQHKDGIPWEVWERQGLVTLTEGDVIHPDLIEQAVKDAHDLYDLHKVAYDPWNATQMALHLQEYGVAMEEFGQNLRNFNEPTKEFEKLLKEGKLIHGGHLVLNWMAQNVMVITDNSGNVRPVKPEHGSPKRVDGIIGGVMALALAMLGDGESWYTSGCFLD